MIRTSFIDGPAKDTILILKRSPIFLRVVIAYDGKVNALDQLDDEARQNETIHIYVRTGEQMTVFVCGRNGYSDNFVMVNYKRYETDIDDATMRDNESWREWANREGRAISENSQMKT